MSDVAEGVNHRVDLGVGEDVGGWRGRLQLRARSSALSLCLVDRLDQRRWIDAGLNRVPEPAQPCLDLVEPLRYPPLSRTGLCAAVGFLRYDERGDGLIDVVAVIQLTNPGVERVITARSDVGITCISFGNTLRDASRKGWDEFARDLRPVYTAGNAEMAAVRFAEFADKWDTR